MSDINKKKNSLHQKAEAIVNSKNSRVFNNFAILSMDKIQTLVHDLEVHKIELEMQNEELLKSHKELTEAKKCYFDLYELAPIAYCTLSEEGLIKEANRKASLLLGLDKNKLIKKLFSNFIQKDYQDTYYLFRKKLLESKKHSECELKLIQNDKTLFWAQLSAEVNKDDNTQEVRLLIKNISKRKESEKNLQIVTKELAKLNNTLEERIHKEIEKSDKKTRYILHQSRLAQIGEMLSMIAHQWRQPLSVISSTSINLQMRLELEVFDLESKEGIKEASKYLIEELKIIELNVDDLSITIDAFRNFHKQNKKMVTVTTESIIKKTLNIIKASLLSDNIEVIEDYNSTLTLELYDGEMMQVILNILKNAQDNFKEKKTKNSYIKIVTKERTISISNNGGKIPEDIQKKIFDPYFSTKDEKNGTGLGLYISKTIVEEHHNGKLNVENINDGVCFTIELLSSPKKIKE